MAVLLEVDYFNSYWIKKLTGGGAGSSIPISSAISPGPAYPGTTGQPPGGNEYIWYVEEARIRGGYNNVATDYGVKAYLDEPEPIQQHRFNSLIYSGLYNSRTGINKTNVFSVADDLIRSADPQNGSIQKTYAEDTNLIVLQQDKCSRALIDKDTIYTTEGGTQTQAGAKVIGQIVPYTGEYGISNNPESFAVYGYRKYFTDKDRNAVLRLSNDGLTEISAYGMTDYFRDEFANISEVASNYNVDGVLGVTSTNTSNVVKVTTSTLTGTLLPGMACAFSSDTGATWTNALGFITQTVVSGANTEVHLSELFVNLTAGPTIMIRFYYPTVGKMIGGWDIHNKNYVLSLQTNPASISTLSTTYNTLCFDEQINGWVSFFTYKPTLIGSLRNKFYSLDNNNLYQHYDTSVLNNRGSFYGVQSPSNVIFVFNPEPSNVKVFKTVAYEGSNGWEINSFVSGFEQPNPSASVPGTYISNQDTSKKIYSYEEGLYTNSVTGQPQRAGFDRKENRYVANLVSSSVARAGEVRFGAEMTGIKGYFATVTIETDNTTELGGMKELWAVSSGYVPSS